MNCPYLKVVYFNVCGAFDYKIYNIKDKVIGVNCNPFHPLCRCTTVPYYDWLESDNTRITRDLDTGKTETVKNMSFETWENNYVGKEKWEYKHKANENYRKDLTLWNKYKRVLGKNNLPTTFEKLQEMKYNDVVKWKKIKNDKLKILSTDFGKLETVVRKNLEGHLTNNSIERLDNRPLNVNTGEKMNRVMVLHTLRYPLHREVVKFKEDNFGVYRTGYRLIGKYVTISINSLEETVITVMPTKSKNRRKYGKQT